MNNQITATIKKFNMISSGDTVLLAVSGGADSMLMLDYFVKNKDILGIDIKVAHIEHGIRGESSVDDAIFVKEYCEKHNIEFDMLSINAPAEARLAGLGVEEYSRNRRYEFFDTIECDKIATAHNLTDNVETFIYRLARGTGIKGACGIPAVRGKIIRPLIEINAEDIRHYCKSNNIPYRIDATNLDCKYSRNKIRNEILPLLCEINSDYEARISSFITDMNEVSSFIESECNAVYSSMLDNNRLIIDRLKVLEAPIFKAVLIRYFSENDVALDRLHLCEVQKLIDKPSKYQISGNIFAVSNKKFLRIADMNQCGNDFEYSVKILNIDEFNSKDIDFYFDCDKIIGNLQIRTRKAGDKIRPATRNCEKTLKKLYNELEIPVELRDSVPVLCDDYGVIAVYPYCVSERVKLDKDTEKVITINFPSEDK